MKNKRGLQILSLSQISVLIIGIFAVAFLIGGIDRVRGQTAGLTEIRRFGNAIYYVRDGNVMVSTDGGMSVAESALTESQVNSLSVPTCLFSSTKILIPYLDNGEYLSDEKLEKLNNALGENSREREREMNKKAGLSLVQIGILVLGVVSFGYLIGNEFGVVSGQTTETYYWIMDGKLGTGQIQNYPAGAEILNKGQYDALSSLSYLSPSTQISLANLQTKAISEISIGDEVLSYDFETGKLIKEIVRGVIVSQKSEYLVINDVLEITPNHEVLINGNWIAVGEAKVGDYFLGANLEKVFIEKIEKGILENPMEVYDLDLGGKWYFAEGVLVHNSGPSTTPTKTSWSDWFFDDLKYDGWGNLGQGLVQSLAWAGLAYMAGQMLGPMFGLDEDQTDVLSESLAIGAFLGRATYNLANQGVSGFNWMNPTTGGWIVGLLAAALYFYFNYEEVDNYAIEVTCAPWEAPIGGDYCEACNNQGDLPCSAYQCRSLGQSCELVNQGTDEEKCVWINEGDVNPPAIEPWLDALLEGYEYTPNNAISPPDRGVFIVNSNSEDGCVDAYTPLTFGVEIVGGGVNNQPEPAKCKIDYIRKDSFDEMDYWFGDSQLSLYEHTEALSLPGLSAYESENIEITNDGEYTLYVRCQDSNGNSNTADFVFQFCIDKGPDTTAPAIITTSVINGMPIQYNQTSLDLIVYVNEPAECKWSRLDEDYKEMETSMTCSKSVTELNAQMLYECKTTLTGLENDKDNVFYFRCKDQPTGTAEADRNTNTESQPKEGFVIKGTTPLVLSGVGPNGTVRDNTDSVKVTLTASTNAGAEEGKSLCYYKNSSAPEKDYVMFFSTASYTHSQDIYLSEGSYSYSIKCVDLGGNSDTKTTSFYVEADSEAPTVTRAYREENNLKLITDEKAECVYDVRNCNYLFSDGISFTTIEGTEHYLEWDSSKNLYVKCRDEYGNEPYPADSCSIIVQPFQIYTK